MEIFNNGIIKKDIKFISTTLVVIRQEISASDYEGENIINYKTYFLIGWDVSGSCNPDFIDIEITLQDKEEEIITEIISLELKDLITLINK